MATNPSNVDKEPRVESPNADSVEGAAGRNALDDSREEADMHASPDPSAAGPRESLPEDKITSTTTNEDDATSGDQDIDTAGTAHDDQSPTKSM